eukprot:CAMPEP_0196728332 /NCGR_PEP_ID=MMETSP1091-20130531/9032_1 /TAXON_ID=302021 /ORGANISM="Rhodomonas sp., Strain CCMP768" /LENGTH=166 /DNA_ID=CAMNT_0042071061 /DNA_START=19 /DNA_END=516 /DNA_ORIENTATION=-
MSHQDQRSNQNDGVDSHVLDRAEVVRFEDIGEIPHRPSRGMRGEFFHRRTIATDEGSCVDDGLHIKCKADSRARSANEFEGQPLPRRRVRYQPAELWSSDEDEMVERTPVHALPDSRTQGGKRSTLAERLVARVNAATFGLLSLVEQADKAWSGDEGVQNLQIAMQ